MSNHSPITPPDDLAQPWLSDNYTVREIRAARAMAVSPSEAEQAFATPWSSSTTNPSPITPPPELVKQWLTEGHHQDYCSASEHAIAQTAQWGYQQATKELETFLRKGNDAH